MARWLPLTFYNRRNNGVEAFTNRTFTVAAMEFDAIAPSIRVRTPRIFGGELSGYWVPITTRTTLG